MIEAINIPQAEAVMETAVILQSCLRQVEYLAHQLNTDRIIRELQAENGLLRRQVAELEAKGAPHVDLSEQAGEEQVSSL